MAILFMDAAAERLEWWMQELRRNLEGHDIRLWPDEVGDPSEIEIAVIGLPPKGELARFPNLRALLSTWAGVDRLMGEGILPPGIPLGRLVDRSLRKDMTLHVVHWVLHFHREYHRYRTFQRENRWHKLPYRERSERRIGILGLGVLGSDAARKVAEMGFTVAGWDAVERVIDGVECFIGRDRLIPFLNRTDILVSLLPLTPETRGIVNREMLAALPEGSYVISCARGAHVVEEDLVAALDSGHVAAAALDVFCEEPLPPTHPFWQHPHVFVTPHTSASTNPRTAAEEIAEDVRRILKGQPPRYQVDLKRGY